MPYIQHFLPGRTVMVDWALKTKLSSGFGVLPPCYMLNLSLVFDILDSVQLQWHNMRDVGHMKQRCASTLFSSVSFLLRR